MKRFIFGILAFIIVSGTVPFSAFAAVNPGDQDFKEYLMEIGMSEEEFTTYLSDYHESTLDEFDTLEDLSDYLGPQLTEENINEVLTDLEITEEELNQFLTENNTSLEDYIFVDDLYFDLSEWLYTEELTPITEESLQTLLEEFGFETKEELEQFLNATGDSIENYDNIEELTWAISEQYFMESKDDFINTLDSFGLSLAEANKLGNHALSIFENPEADPEELLMKLEEISSRLMAFPEFESATDLSAESIAEFIDIWNDLLELMELKVEYYLAKDGQTIPVSFSNLLQMDNTNGADLMIKILSNDGEMLADMIITKDMFDSEFIEETGQNLEESTEAAQEVVQAAKSAPPAAKKVAKTVNGGKLPNTASDYLQNTLAGLAIALFGFIALRRVSTKRA